MKSPYETLQEQLKARFPRIITGDNEVVDEVDSEHTVERLAPLYQLPAWELLKDTRELSRKLRIAGHPFTSSPCEGSCTDEGAPKYENASSGTSIDQGCGRNRDGEVDENIAVDKNSRL
jgi:hypothetical protein